MTYKVHDKIIYNKEIWTIIRIDKRFKHELTIINNTKILFVSSNEVLPYTEDNLLRIL